MTADQERLGPLEAIRRCRVVAGVLVLLHLGLSATPQAVDLLIALGRDGSVAAWLGLGAGTAWLALNDWFWSGFALARSGQQGGQCHGRTAVVLPSSRGHIVADRCRRAAHGVHQHPGGDGVARRRRAPPCGVGGARRGVPPPPGPGPAHRPSQCPALEAAWDARWRAVFGDGRLAAPFLDLWPDGRPWPALLLNGTSLNGGGRLVVSNLQLGADRVGGDGADLLALLGGDVPASATAGSSARFPYIGPLGTFRTVAGTFDAVADGGYFENLGASTLLELLDALDVMARRHGRPVRFVVLQLVNDPDAGSGAARAGDYEPPWSLLPRGLTGPPTVLLRTREAWGVSASEALARRVVALGGAYVPVRLGRSPTGRMAPLGWSLSAVAREVINSQWTPACRDRVLAGAGFAGMPVPPPAGADPMRMEVMAMWAGAACQAVDPALR